MVIGHELNFNPLRYTVMAFCKKHFGKKSLQIYNMYQLKQE